MSSVGTSSRGKAEYDGKRVGKRESDLRFGRYTFVLFYFSSVPFFSSFFPRYHRFIDRPSVLTSSQKTDSDDDGDDVTTSAPAPDSPINRPRPPYCHHRYYYHRTSKQPESTASAVRPCTAPGPYNTLRRTWFSLHM